MTRAGIVAGGTILAPYILPSGRLFAASGEQKAKHVLFVMFGGGIRQQESVLQRYLMDAQPTADGANEGNIMYNLFEGAPPTRKIVYGNDGNLPGDTPIAKILSQTIERQGTTFKEVRTVSAGHYSAYTGMVQGKTTTTIGLREKPVFPTVFEYVRRHMGAAEGAASKVWFIGENIGNSTPLLNYGIQPNYGMKYGANFFAPPVTFGYQGIDSFAGGPIYHPDEEMKYIYKMKYFMDNYYRNVGGVLDSLGNTEMEKFQIKTFMEKLHRNTAGSDVIDCALEVMNEFTPTLTVMNFNGGVDICHGDFTKYLQAIHLNDNKVARLWQGVQKIPGMAGNTAMILCPDMGRNTKGSAVLDSNNFKSFDHDGGDPNVNRIFTQMVGPGIPVNVQVGSESNPVGNSADCVMTIADLLGIKQDVQNAGFINDTMSFLDQI